MQNPKTGYYDAKKADIPATDVPTLRLPVEPHGGESQNLPPLQEPQLERAADSTELWLITAPDGELEYVEVIR